jgi:integrase
MPVRVAPLSARGVAALRPGEEKSDGLLFGLRVRCTSVGELSWSLLVADTAGAKRRFSVGTGLSLAEARQQATMLRQKIREGVDPGEERRVKRRLGQDARKGIGTLGELVDRYYETGPGVSLRTKRDQKGIIRHVFAPLLVKPGLELTRLAVQLCADDHPSAASGSTALASLRPILRWAAKRGLAADDRWRELERPVVHTHRQGRRHLAEADLARLWPLWTGPYGTAAKFILLTGVRLREATGATWSEFDLDAATWTIAAERRKDTRSRRKVTMEPQQSLLIPLSRQAVDLVRGASRHGDGDLVLTGRRGGALVNWQRWLRSLATTSGINGWSPHTLRRTCATLCGELGAPPHVIDAILGHRVVGGALQNLYRRNRYLSEHRNALQGLADHLVGP